MEQATVDAVMEDWTTAKIPDKTRAALRFLETQTTHPHDITEAFVTELASEGLNRAAIEDIANTGFYFNFINRIADAYDFPQPNPKQQKKQAKMLDFMGRRIGPTGDQDQSWTRSKDGKIRPVELEEARQLLFNIKGVTDPLFRRSVEYFSAEKWGGARSEHRINIPGDLYHYVESVSLHAHRIIDENVEHLKTSGYTDRELYEITFAAALGAAMPAMENLFGVLYGSEEG